MKRDKMKHDATVADRLQELCRERFGGSGRKMAAALNVSQAAGWRIMSGKQEPTGAFLAGLAALPDVDLNWIFRGEGKPPQAAQTVALPIAQELLPGPPQEFSDRLSAETFGVSGNLYRPTRYWLKVRATDPVVRRKTRSIRAGDLLLMDADRSAIPPPHELTEHLCGVRVNTADGPRLRLGSITYQVEDAKGEAAVLEFDTSDLGIKRSELVEEIVVRKHPDGRFHTYSRELKLVRGKPTELSHLEYEPILPSIRYEDIICVCVLLVRRQTLQLSNG